LWVRVPREAEEQVWMLETLCKVVRVPARNKSTDRCPLIWLQNHNPIGYQHRIPRTITALVQTMRFHTFKRCLGSMR
jgi:hypothetical protein